MNFSAFSITVLGARSCGAGGEVGWEAWDLGDRRRLRVGAERFPTRSRASPARARTDEELDAGRPASVVRRRDWWRKSSQKAGAATESSAQTADGAPSRAMNA